MWINTTILIVNNCDKQRLQDRANQIATALEQCGIQEFKLIDFKEISEFEITEKIKAVILSGSSANLGSPKYLSMCKEVMKFLRHVDSARALGIR